ncbi:hypothetical protein NGM36_24840 [Streptomyces mutabilis]|uniref:DUF6907 domain-containing protein n=1 Tax=Streptomyces mutabilis TaxID=67332 RepID=UPI0022BA2123|nr:hypothetical protein [Streptomyces mutabilis]MCZ9352957.1 hypothetical protein [Streptomyces mutabilis]
MSKVPMTSTATSTRPDQRTGVTVAIGATSYPLPHNAPLDLWATPSMDDVYAYEVVYYPGRISLADAKANVHAQLAEHNVQVTDFLNEDGPLTAQMRGAEWMARWGCPPWCINDHSEPNATDWHATPQIETKMRNIAADHTAAENARFPWLAAKTVVINDKPQAYGRETRVWLDFGTSTGELTPTEARKALVAMRGFVIELECLVDQAEKIAADDFEGDPEIARLDREAQDRWIKARTAELEVKADALLAEARG